MNVTTAITIRTANPTRNGKTRRDRENGNPQRNANNKAARAQWQKECKGKHLMLPAFPTYTCNGKGNSSKPRKSK